MVGSWWGVRVFEMEEDSKKPLSDYTFEEYKELTKDEQEHLEGEATGEEIDAWYDKYEKEYEEDAEKWSEEFFESIRKERQERGELSNKSYLIVWGIIILVFLIYWLSR